VREEDGQRRPDVHLVEAALGEKLVGRRVRLRALSLSRVVRQAHGQGGGAVLVGGRKPLQLLERAAELTRRLEESRVLEAGLGVRRCVPQDRLVRGEGLGRGRGVLLAVLLVEAAEVEVRVGVVRRAEDGLAETLLRGCVVPSPASARPGSWTAGLAG
jgi:hypothetical protein